MTYIRGGYIINIMSQILYFNVKLEKNNIVRFQGLESGAKY